MPNHKFRIGIDLGGTKISYVIMDQEGKIHSKRRLPSPQNSYDKTVYALTKVVKGNLGNFPSLVSVGIGVPGSVSPVTKTIQNANSTWLNGKPFEQDMSAALSMPVRIANDANCFALSEAVDGAGKTGKCIFGVILGTGCGGGLVIDKKLVNGPRGIAGEWGHNPLPWPDKSELGVTGCWCGQSGCIETWVSGPGFSKDHHRRTGKHLTAVEISQQAQSGDSQAQISLDKLASRLARGLASVVNILDPDQIILGGGLSQIDYLYTALPRLMTPYIFCDHSNITIKPPAHGDDSGVRGAAWLWN